MAFALFTTLSSDPRQTRIGRNFAFLSALTTQINWVSKYHSLKEAGNHFVKNQAVFLRPRQNNVIAAKHEFRKE
jgi:hypothetical protein